jgi:hypothetical protein
VTPEQRTQSPIRMNISMLRKIGSLPGIVLAAGLLLGLGACGDAAEPELERFELARTQAGELPALLGERGGCRFEAVEGSVELGLDGAYVAELLRRRLCLPHVLGDTIREAETTFSDRGEGTYTTKGDSVFFRFSSGASAGFGVLYGDTLVVQGPGQTLYYHRQESGQ